MADLAHLPYGQIIGDVGVKLLEDTNKRPNVARLARFPKTPYTSRLLIRVYRWWKEISSRPAWLTVVAEGKAA